MCAGTILGLTDVSTINHINVTLEHNPYPKVPARHLGHVRLTSLSVIKFDARTQWCDPKPSANVKKLHAMSHNLGINARQG
jgi:hypothetical protein